MSENTWKEYFERTKDIKPRPLLVKAVDFVNDKNEALDLGSGALNDVKFLVSKGFKHINAVDSKPLAQDIIQNFPPEIVSYVISTFEDFDFVEDKYDLINAQYSLPFNPQNTFERVFKSITSSLKTGGILTGQFFGEKDEWNVPDHKMNFQTREQAEKFLNGLEIIDFKEEEADRPTAKGDMKHWHVFHFIVRK
ncbi:MAG: class I SAM-dependent methyltransferase [Candidatus Paceibacterota bacterium]